MGYFWARKSAIHGSSTSALLGLGRPWSTP